MEAVWCLSLLFLGVQSHDLHLSSSNRTKKISLLDKRDGSSLILDVRANKLAVIDPKVAAAVFVDLNGNKGFYVTNHQLARFGRRERGWGRARSSDEIVDVVDQLYADYEELTTTPSLTTQFSTSSSEEDDSETVESTESHHQEATRYASLAEDLFNFLSNAAPKVGEVFEFDRGLSKGKDLLIKTLEKLGPKISTLIRDNPRGLRPVLHHMSSVLRGIYNLHSKQPSIKNFDIEGLYRANLTQLMIYQAIFPNQTVSPLQPMEHVDVPAIQLLNDFLKEAMEAHDNLHTPTSVLQLLGNISEKTNGLHVVDVVTAQLIALNNPSNANIKILTRILLEYALSPRHPRVSTKAIHESLQDELEVSKEIAYYVEKSECLNSTIEEVASLQRHGSLDDLLDILINRRAILPLQKSIPDLILAVISKIDSDLSPCLPRLFPQLPDIFKLKPLVKNLISIGEGIVDPIGALKKNRITAAIFDEIAGALARASKNRVEISAILNLSLDLKIVRELPNVLKALFVGYPDDDSVSDDEISDEESPDDLLVA